MNNIEHMAEIVNDWLTNASEKDQKAFKERSKEDLVVYHHDLGRQIRNHFKLWENEWEPNLINGVDFAEDHPDAVSMRVIEAVWEKYQ